MGVGATLSATVIQTCTVVLASASEWYARASPASVAPRGVSLHDAPRGPLHGGSLHEGVADFFHTDLTCVRLILMVLLAFQRTTTTANATTATIVA